MEKHLKKSELIPVDLIIEILLRLPAKSILRFRCLSKEWASILGRHYFTDMFLTMSSSRPRFLFSFSTDFSTDNGKWFFLSAPQPLNPDQNLSSIVVDYHMSFPTKTCSSYIQAPVLGLVSTKEVRFHIYHVHHDVKTMIYNPSTGESILLPRITSLVNTRTFFGYDPIDKQHKVLCISDRRDDYYDNIIPWKRQDIENRVDYYDNIIPWKRQDIENRVLTLGTGKLSWKNIGCSVGHFPICDGICINGVLYYSADKGSKFPKPYTLVCFDVRSETFKFVEPPDNIHVTWRSTMINYNGKLGVLLDDYIGFSSETTSLELWVLDDAEKNKWLQHIYVLPPLWKTLVVDTKLHIVGMTCNGEIVLSPHFLVDPFYIFFYNLAKNSILRVRVQGIESIHIKGQYIYTYIDHIEDVKRI